MSRHALGVVGLALLAVGILGMVVGLVVVTASTQTAATAPQLTLPIPRVPAPRSTPGTGTDGFSSSGQRIYDSGIGHDGVIAFSGGMMVGRGRMSDGPLPCANCHHSDGRGGPVQTRRGVPNLSAADIRYSTLTSPSTENGKRRPGWTDAQIATAIRTGVAADGTQLDQGMPRFDMDGQDMADLLVYLKELSAT